MSSTEIVRQLPTDNYLISPVMDLALARQRINELQSFVKDYLVQDEDYGVIPGTKKPTLLKPGADKLCELYGLYDDYEFIRSVEDLEKGIYDYTIKCILVDRRRGVMVSAGLGSCSSLESKYRWRDSKRLCPTCNKDSIIKGKEEYGGGWLCFAKKGGCGAKFSDGDQSIEGQSIGRAINEDIADLKNVVLKMAKKRAKIDATLSATRSSGLFTQDMEDMAPTQSYSQVQDAPPVENNDPPAVERPDPGTDEWLLALRETANYADFFENVHPAVKNYPKEFITAVTEPAMKELFRILGTVDQFNTVLMPLSRIAFEVRKPLVKAIAAEAKRRGYGIDRTSGSYTDGGAK